MLNPNWLKTFVALAGVGSFTKTAELLDMTQAGVSQHVRQLETQLGLLFIRRPRQLELTPAGKALLDYCRELEQLDQRLKMHLAGTEADVGEVSLITPGSIGLFLYPVLLELQVQNRGLVVRHRFAPAREVLEAVLDNRFELGLVTLKPEDPRLSASAFIDEPLELIVAAHENIDSWQDLARLGFIDHPDGRSMAARLLSRQYPHHLGVAGLPVHGFSNQIGLILEPVARGLGFTVLPRYARKAFRDPLALKVVESASSVVDTLWLIHRSEWPLSKRAQRAVEHLRTSVALSQAPT